MNRPALTTPAPWRFGEFRTLPRGCPQRRRAAAYLRRLLVIRRAGQELRRFEAMRRASLWSSATAVGCIETGWLFRTPYAAAKELDVYDTAIIRSAKYGSPVRCFRWPTTFHFVWLNKPRWRPKTVWEVRGAVGCVQTGDLFLTAGAAQQWAQTSSHQMIHHSAQRGGMVHGKWNFVWLNLKRRRDAERQRTAQRRKDSVIREDRDRQDNRGGRRQSQACAV